MNHPHSVVIFSNCQGEGLQICLLDLLRGTDIPVHLVASYRDFTEVQARQMSECTLLIEQVQRNERCPTDTYLKPNTPRISFPVLYSLALWPFAQGDRVGEPADRPPLFDNPINDSQIAALMAQGGETETILDAYEAMDYAALADLDGLFDRNRAMIRDLETRADIGLWDNIETRFTTEPTFHSFYHPYPAALYPAYKAACEFVVDIIGGDTGAVPGTLDRWVKTDTFQLQQVPIHPSVARKLNLAWHKPDRRYRLRYQGALTFREFWRTYLDYDVDDAVEKASMIVEKDDGAASLALLDSIPGVSPDRDVIRGQALLRGRRYEEARTLMADVLDRQDPRIFGRVALDTWLRAAAECKDPSDGERAIQLVTQYHDHAAVQYFGGYLLRHIGQEALGIEALIAAGRLCPADADYANQAGSAFDAMGAKADAIASFNRAVLYASPSARPGAVELARTYAANNTPRPAAPVAKRGFWQRLFG